MGITVAIPGARFQALSAVDRRGHRDEGRSHRNERSGSRERHSSGRGDERERGRRSHDRDLDRSREGSAGRGERRCCNLSDAQCSSRSACCVDAAARCLAAHDAELHPAACHWSLSASAVLPSERVYPAEFSPCSVRNRPNAAAHVVGQTHSASWKGLWVVAQSWGCRGVCM